MPISYEQLQGARLEDLEASPELTSTFGQLYGYDGGKLLSYYKSGYRSFDADKAYTLSNRGGFNFGELETRYNRYSNWNNPLNQTDYAAAQTERESGLSEINKLEGYYRNLGLDPSTISELQRYKTGFGSVAGGGTTSIQAAQEAQPTAPAVSQPGYTIQASGGPNGPPPGATYITSPAGLEGLTEDQIWREPGTGKIYRLSEGMTKISGPSGLQGLTEDQIWRDANGDIYRKPSLDERLPGESVTDYAERVGSSVGTEGGSPAAGTSEAYREQLKEQIKDELLPDGGLPDAPNTADERIRLRREQGIINDEQDLSDLRNESRLAQEEMRQFKATSGQGMTEYGRLGAVSEKERNLSFRLEGLALREQSLVERINSKNSYINQVMQDQQFDYQTGMQRWNIEFQTNAKVNELVNSQLDQEQQDNLSFLTTTANLMKESGLPYDQWDPAMKASTEAASMRLGWPKTFFKSVFSNVAPDEKILQTFLQDNPQGGKDAYSIVQKADGTTTIIKASGGLPASAVAQSQGSLKTSTVDVGGRMLVIDEYGNTIKDLGPSKTGLEMESDLEKEAARETSSENQSNLVISAVEEAIGLIEPTSKLGPLGRVVASKVPGTKSFDLAKVIDTIKANLGFDALQKMRDQSPTGGALGAISDREIGLLQATVASLDIGQSTDQLEAKLNDIKTHYGNWQNAVTQAAAGKNSSAISEAMSSYGPDEVIKGLSSKPGATGTMIDVSRALGIPDQEYVKRAGELGRDATKIWDWLKGKVQEAEGVSAADTNAETRRVANAIGQFESGGNYKALGPVLKSGSYKGDRAYGKYQVMGKNIPSWTKEALGRSMTPAQFLADKKAQDAVAEYRMGKLLAQGYSVEDIASIWFSGQPLSKAKGKRDQLGTSVPQYVKRVRSIYNQG